MATVSRFFLAFFCLVVCFFPSSKSSNNFGSLKLCPAGGRAFAMAWSLACEMRRRKRSLDLEDELDYQKRATEDQAMRPATIKEIMKVCCQLGCELRDLSAYCDPFSGWNQ